MCRACTILLHYTERFEQRVKFIAASDQDSNTDPVKIEKGTKGIEIPVKGLIFRVPFKVTGNPALDVIDLVRVLAHFFFIDQKPGSQLVLFPAEFLLEN